MIQELIFENVEEFKLILKSKWCNIFIEIS